MCGNPQEVEDPMHVDQRRRKNNKQNKKKPQKNKKEGGGVLPPGVLLGAVLMQRQWQCFPPGFSINTTGPIARLRGATPPVYPFFEKKVRVGRLLSTNNLQTNGLVSTNSLEIWPVKSGGIWRPNDDQPNRGAVEQERTRCASWVRAHVFSCREIAPRRSCLIGGCASRCHVCRASRS